MSRKGFLRLAGAILAGAALPVAAAGCGGRGEGSGFEGSAPEGTEASQETVELPTPRGMLRGVLHTAGDAGTGGGDRGVVVMVGGAGGGIHGPAGVYEELADHLSGGVTALRLEYREPNRLDECVYDVLAAVSALEDRGYGKVALIGWSFGGAVVIRAGVESGRVVGVATVASQTYGAEGVGELSPKSLLLIHGTADTVLPSELSRHLYARAGEPKELVLYPGDGHGVEEHRSEMLEKLYGWSLGLLDGGSA